MLGPKRGAIVIVIVVNKIITIVIVIVIIVIVLVLITVIMYLRGNWSPGFLDYLLPKTPRGFRRFSEISEQNKLPAHLETTKTGS